jgi:hypothetical protein
MYYQKVYKNLRKGEFPSAKAHDAYFTPQRKEIMSRFFSKEDMAKMDKLGGFVKVIKQQEKELGNLEKAFNKAFEGKIQRWNAEEISTHFQKMSLDEVRVLNSLLKKTPAVKDAFLKSIRMDIADKIVPISAKQEAIDYKRLTTAINQNAEKFKLLGEAEYLRNLRVLQNNVEMLQPGKPFGKEGQGIELRFFRLLFGALSRPQRVLTANQERLFNERDRLQHKILTSPLALKKFLALRDKQINDEKVMVWLMAGIQDYD